MTPGPTAPGPTAPGSTAPGPSMPGQATPGPARAGATRRWHEALAAAVLLTRLPVGGLVPAGAWPAGGACVWAYPLVGALVGAAGGLVHAGLAALALPEPLPALWAVAATLVLTGALHEDGLADMADGLGGATREGRLRIMRDSRIGSYGACALLLSLGVRVAAVAALRAPLAAGLALVLAGGLGRAAMLLVLRLLPPARADGLAAGLAPSRPALATGLLLGLALPLLLLLGLQSAGLSPGGLAVPGGRPLAGLAVALALPGAAAAALGVGALARRALGGHTGDVLGCAEQVAECVVLTSLCVGLG